jgi:hypothetical protein
MGAAKAKDYIKLAPNIYEKIAQVNTAFIF